MEDFLDDTLEKEIHQRKRQIEELTKTNERKYMRRIDLENSKAALDNQKDHQELPSHCCENRETDLKIFNESDHPTYTKDVLVNDKDQSYNPSSLDVSYIDNAFRAVGLPIRVFGESESDRLLRLREIEDKQQFFQQIPKFHNQVGSSETSANAAVHRKQRSNPRRPADEDVQISEHMLENNQILAEKLVKRFLRRLLDEWGDELQGQSADMKKSMEGRSAFKAYEQTCLHIKPLFMLLKKNEIEKDVLLHVVRICSLMQCQEYTKANDVYYLLSIGNAPWPIGVTSVGIHARSARDKIGSNQVAHVLNDERQRKWIQCIKRLMSFCQRRYPPDDLSKTVGFVPSFDEA